jgi:GH15 family glucan-1,4-alpha-glucosidase
MAVLTLEPALPAVRQSQRGPLTACLCLLLIVMISSSGLVAHRNLDTTIPLDAVAVAVGPDGAVVEVATPDELVPGTRVLAGMPDSLDLAREQAAWLAAGTVPQVSGLDSDMVALALLDLHVLSRTYGVPVAGWSDPWRYVWPRDSALAAAALARTGHTADAERIVGFLQQAQPESGVFQARYLPDGSGVPDARGVELDGLGWALWATAQLAAELPQSDRTAFVQRHRRLVDRSTKAALGSIDNPSSLPPPSADYWEVKETKLTLATAAVLCAGLESGAQLYRILGEVGAAEQAGSAAQRLRAAIGAAFGQNGYPRRLGGRSDSTDLGVDFLLPPVGSTVDRAVVQAWEQAPLLMWRPAGGLAPGGSWRRDGVSWTNVTASRAVTAAYLGRRDEALARLRWLDQHRTAAGSLPEKVLPDGQPASVSPLAWTAAAVVITADQLDS